jgi:hypothetical protein
MSCILSRDLKTCEIAREFPQDGKKLNAPDGSGGSVPARSGKISHRGGRFLRRLAWQA